MSLLRNRFARIGLLTFVLLFIAYTALGFWLVPRLVRGNLQDLAREQYQRELQAGEVTFNPFTLVLEIRDLSFPDADGAQLLEAAGVGNVPKAVRRNIDDECETRPGVGRLTGARAANKGGN